MGEEGTGVKGKLVGKAELSLLTLLSKLTVRLEGGEA